MVANDCWRKSLKAFGRLSFQPLGENPLLGHSASTLDEVGPLRLTFLTENRKTWRLFTFPCLHAGAIHLVINLCSVVFIGVHSEQEFGTLIAGLIYVLYAFNGTLMAALFVEKSPTVGSSGSIWVTWSYTFCSDSELGIIHQQVYSSCISTICRHWKFPPCPQFREFVQGKGGLLDYNRKSTIKSRLRQKYRSVCLFLFVLMLAGCLVAVFHGINMNQYCKWCDCVPSKRWSCSEMKAFCETMMSNEQMTLTRMSNGIPKLG
ncbi:hypothetical protein M0R45_001317 [Rubus argutus]|uniref:RHOMBOID-like protein n=1 Tax=Rubus argutus TaxID=59490 RepID=A0AAW1VKY9_RUBAR